MTCVVVEVVQCDQHPVQLVVGQQTGAIEDPCVGSRGQQVIRSEPPVEMDAHRQAGQRIGGAADLERGVAAQRLVEPHALAEQLAQRAPGGVIELRPRIVDRRGLAVAVLGLALAGMARIPRKE